MKLSRYIEIVEKQLVGSHDHKAVNALHSFKDDLGADSLDMVELVVAFEDELGIELPDTIVDEDRVAIFYSKILKVLNFELDK